MCDYIHQRYRRTDGRTTYWYYGKIALCIASRGKNKKKQISYLLKVSLSYVQIAIMLCIGNA